jgi:hypothetical protein
MKRAWITAAVIGTAALCAPAVASAGLLDSTSSAGKTSASPLNLAPLLTLNKADSSSTDSHVTVLNVGGVDLLAKSTAPDGTTQNTGALAPVGGVVDSLNQGLCPAGPAATGNCIVVLYNGKTDVDRSDALGSDNTHNSSAATLGINLGDTGLFLLGSQTASEQKTPTGGTSTCNNTSRSYILVTKSQLLPTNVNGLDKTSTSLNQAC